MTLADASFPSSSGQKMKFFVDQTTHVEPEIPEEKKLEEQFNSLSVNQPKSSKHDNFQSASGGSSSSMNGCNLGKNFPQL
mmetsp:Transcript_24213/g.37300  ORF Transcript_24213/g.37300 Transcript_24213/m.37300 type:complete len:80 (+) Transcript_24213:252-491(+)|eukprot:CAMPEP_0170491592 /NCGR_PEP_ID=MMETSP0208-20121228/11138_1 /TAXON_ID=197538 /ORGANISM="Strombidium inclinatum, Strain S3" /LENGTH=79 /DNA_ID=CAMNT_0010767189 /DNA_START=252 /DNA_END=491 /DNA_ORIENTATION=-